MIKLDENLQIINKTLKFHINRLLLIWVTKLSSAECGFEPPNSKAMQFNCKQRSHTQIYLPFVDGLLKVDAVSHVYLLQWVYASMSGDIDVSRSRPRLH